MRDDSLRRAATAATSPPLAGLERASTGLVSRSEFFALLFAVSCANGLAAKAVDAVRQFGWWDAAVGTFGISVVVWIACGAGLSLLLQDRSRGQSSDEPITGSDWIAGAGVLALAAIPFGAMSWIGQTVLALYVIRVSGPHSARHRGAWILLAVTVPMCWSRLLFALLSRWILEADAVLVSLVLGTRRIGNTVRFADDPDFFQIFPACSSLANMSLAILCWVTVSKVTEHRMRAADLAWCSLACLSVVAVNVTRISLIGFHRDRFELFHGVVGATVASWVALALMAGISFWSVRRDLARR